MIIGAGLSGGTAIAVVPPVTFQVLFSPASGGFSRIRFAESGRVFDFT